MTQLSSTDSTCKVRWKMWLFKISVVTYLTAVCAAQDYSDATFGPTYAPVATAQQEVITTPAYVPPVPSLKLSSGWLEVFRSEKVEFSCAISGISDWTFTWYRNGDKIDQGPNFSFPGDGSVLTITAATNSGTYTCKGLHKSKGVTTQSSNSLELEVHENRPKPKLSRNPKDPEMFPGESITFTCLVDVFVGWEYVWYHNGQELPPAGPNMYSIAAVAHPNQGQYHCKARRGKDPFYTEASDSTLLRVSDPPTPTLKLLSTWSDVFEGEEVKFSCEITSSDWVSKWYRNQTMLQEDDNTSVDEEGLQLNITSVTKAHQGDYACQAQHISRDISSGFSNSINIEVYDDFPTATLSKDGFNSMYVGETVNFTCQVTVSSGWMYQWYKDGNELPDTSNTISNFLGLSKKGSYSCRGIRGDTTTKLSEIKQQDVLEIPVPSLERKTRWHDMFPTESVELSCGMQSGSGWTYTWYKDTSEIQADNTMLFDSNGATLSINSAEPGKHNGRYECKGHLRDRNVKSDSSLPLRLVVHQKKPDVILTQDPEYKVMFPGESVSFSCHIDASTGWKYQWFKDGSPLVESESVYSITPLIATSRGSYKCQGKRGSNNTFTTDFSEAIRLEVRDEKPKPTLTQQPTADKLYTGEPVSFKCKVENSHGWTYYWYKDGALLLSNSSSFPIDSATLQNNGDYDCKATRNRTMLKTDHSDRWNLHISEIPVPSLKNVTPWLDVFPTEGVTFSCGMPTTSDWTYTWYKDAKEVQANASVTYGKDNTTLTIRPASTSHRGEYSCSANLKVRNVKTSRSSELRLEVYDTEPRVTLKENPEHSLMHTDDKVSFSCHINVSSGWEFLWYKDNKLHASGISHSISFVSNANAGSYKCEAQRGTKMVFKTTSQPLKLDFEERPQASITLLTGWGEAFSTDSLVFQCEVTDDQYKDWNYTWFREDHPINASLSGKYKVTPSNDPEQSSYKCQGIRSGRPTYSKKSISHKTRNVLLKRRVLLSIASVLFCGIVVVLLGCVILRFRKKADDDEKPEEANLFLTMAELKDRADAPCPLVEYITDADVNPPSKEGDENGTVCNETTPLPISPPEDKAVTSDDQDTTENNGGLVSFKQ